MVIKEIQKMLESGSKHHEFIESIKDRYGFAYIREVSELNDKYRVDLEELKSSRPDKYEMANEMYVLPCTNLKTGKRALGLTYPILNIADFYFDNEIFFIGYNIFYHFWGQVVDSILDNMPDNSVEFLDKIYSYMDRQDISDLHFFRVSANAYMFTKREISDIDVMGYVDVNRMNDIIRALRIECGDDPFTLSTEIKGRVVKEVSGGEERAFRISMVMNAVGGEEGYSCSIRLLANDLKSLENLSYPKKVVDMIKLACTSHHDGLIIVSGGTNSGKSTLLYAVLNILREEGARILTIENPVEISLPEVIQIDLSRTENAEERNKMTIPKAIKVFLRQDPDVALIGEVRDADEVNGVLMLSETGHLAFTTIHANSVLGTISRMKNLDIDMDTITINVRLIINQSLVKALCGTCKTLDSDGIHYTKGNGKLKLGTKEANCPACNPKGDAAPSAVGLRGRTPVFEIAYFGKLEADQDINDLNKSVSYYISKKDSIMMQYEMGRVDNDIVSDFLGTKVQEFLIGEMFG
jgi:type II secretory ATPase GspE/PulE/Tfp pilus assembly ATPase PilB-like protein